MPPPPHSPNPSPRHPPPAVSPRVGITPPIQPPPPSQPPPPHHHQQLPPPPLSPRHSLHESPRNSLSPRSRSSSIDTSSEAVATSPREKPATRSGSFFMPPSPLIDSSDTTATKSGGGGSMYVAQSPRSGHGPPPPVPREPEELLPPVPSRVGFSQSPTGSQEVATTPRDDLPPIPSSAFLTESSGSTATRDSSTNHSPSTSALSSPRSDLESSGDHHNFKQEPVAHGRLKTRDTSLSASVNWGADSQSPSIDPAAGAPAALAKKRIIGSIRGVVPLVKTHHSDYAVRSSSGIGETQNIATKKTRSDYDKLEGASAEFLAQLASDDASPDPALPPPPLPSLDVGDLPPWDNAVEAELQAVPPPLPPDEFDTDVEVDINVDISDVIPPPPLPQLSPRPLPPIVPDQEDDSHVVPSSPSSNRGSKGEAEEKKERLRIEALKEIIVTEKDYVKDLELIHGVFIQPLQQRSVLSSQEVGLLFSNLSQLVNVNTELLHNFETEGKLIGEAFLSVMQYLKMYKIYCANQPASLKVLEACQTENAHFAAFLLECIEDPRCRGLTLFSYLIKPVQRLCKYPLLIKALLQHTDPGHPDYNNLVKAMAEIGDIVDYVNEGKRKAENSQKILEIQLATDGGEQLGLVKPSRAFVIEHTLQVVFKGGKKPVSRKCVLFNDLLLFLKEKPKRGRLYSDPVSVPLEGVHFTYVHGAGEVKEGIELTTAQKVTYVLLFGSSEEKNKWMKEFKNIFKSLRSQIGGDNTAGGADAAKRAAKLIKKSAAGAAHEKGGTLRGTKSTSSHREKNVGGTMRASAAKRPSIDATASGSAALPASGSPSPRSVPGSNSVPPSPPLTPHNASNSHHNSASPHHHNSTPAPPLSPAAPSSKAAIVESASAAIASFAAPTQLAATSSNVAVPPRPKNPKRLSQGYNSRSLVALKRVNEV
eukprot:TRINITY_DN3330_c1_g2_i1.p1 TRINITY_DN3330_c1_g2~~TRINITY_DN3330_c1_g2_i1.p1  ORF type:complete len:933 (+),score=196.33 TRINITY_DN3330_c1_g2_i1:160-2958(+)